MKQLVLSKRSNTRGNLITYSNSESIISDQFRTIRSNVKFLTEEKNKRIFVITSPEAKEGKSTAAANLAVSFAQQNEKVLLIDANLREPAIHDIFKLSHTNGLTDLLVGKATFEETLKRSEIGNLDIITSGSKIFNPTEMLGSEFMKKFLQWVGSVYDMVLIDSPGILHSTETRVLANQCDGVILVLHRDKTKLEKASEARGVLELSRANLVGAIINEK